MVSPDPSYTDAGGDQWQRYSVVGGLIATVVMTALMMALGDDSPPPTAQFHAKYLGDGDPENSMMAGMLLHFGYGIGAGAVYGWLAVAGLLAISLSGALLTGVVNGAVYGIVLGGFVALEVI